MATGNGSGGYINERMDQAEAMLRQVAADHVIFLQDHQMLLRAQVVMQDSLEKQKVSIDRLRDSIADLKDSQKATDERIGVLVAMFGD